MKNQLNILRATRNNYLKELAGISIEQLNLIPDGFNNNLIWNAAHAVVTQQLLCYKLSGVAMKLSNDAINAYRKGTRPVINIEATEVEQIKNWLLESIEWLEKDIDTDLFQHYKEYSTSYGYTLKTFEDALAFNNVHESMHLGYIIALKKHLKL